MHKRYLSKADSGLNFTRNTHRLLHIDFVWTLYQENYYNLSLLIFKKYKHRFCTIISFYLVVMVSAEPISVYI